MVERGLPSQVKQALNRLLKRIDKLDASGEEKRRLRWWIVKVRDDIIEMENMEK